MEGLRVIHKDAINFQNANYNGGECAQAEITQLGFL